MLASADEAVSALDQPTMDGVNTYFVSWAARQVGLKVALSGLGGDELFAGYSTFTDTPRLMHLETLSRFVPAAFRRLSTPLICNLLENRARPTPCGKPATPGECRTPCRILISLPAFSLRLPTCNASPNALPQKHRRCRRRHLEPTWLAWLERIADQSANSNLSPPSPGSNFAPTWPARFGAILTPSAWPARSKSAPPSRHATRRIMCAPYTDEAASAPKLPKPCYAPRSKTCSPRNPATKKRTFTLPWENWMRTALRPRLEESFSNLAPALEPHLHSPAFKWSGTISSTPAPPGPAPGPSTS